MNGLDYGFRIRDDDWRFVAFNDLRSGDTVVIGKRIGNNFFGIHYATFLGQNRYLSKFGATGPLLVTTLSDMLTVYESN
ncbi:hypothetical protein AAEH85_21370, partial [Shewanella algae]|uniref:hypothetical protein n=1 Tax=Shewanella algae TaxID=38313 RepID=UPI00313B9C0D